MVISCRSTRGSLRLALFLGVGLGLGACGKSPSEVTATAAATSGSASAGQVASSAAPAPISAYAAARVADQVSFGPTPELLANLRQQGIEPWLNAQFGMASSLIEAPDWLSTYNTNDPEASKRAWRYPKEAFFNAALAGPEQLRMRVAWALMQFIPVNNKVPPYALIEHFKLLARHAFGNYGELLRELSVHPAMGQFLDNFSNRPTSSQCPSCAPNENYARELMQLFTIGVVQLNPDGSTVRDAKGKPIETYRQEDVVALAKALTGWRFAPSATVLPTSNWTNAGKLMEPDPGQSAHDRTAKNILGVDFPAGRDASAELDAVISLLTKHPNLAPFVSLRLIQHLVTSDPSPAYLGRVSAVFRDNGAGVTGDMQAVIRTILLDPEARKGDIAGTDAAGFGKIREPVLWYTAALRGLGCIQSLQRPNSGGAPVQPAAQVPFEPPNVFSFYLPTDRAPGSDLLAPEQKLLNTKELTSRLSMLDFLAQPSVENLAAQCGVAELAQLLVRSPNAFIDSLSQRYFRGAMSPVLRSALLDLAAGQTTWGDPAQRAMALLQFALSSPAFGVIK